MREKVSGEALQPQAFREFDRWRSSAQSLRGEPRTWESRPHRGRKRESRPQRGRKRESSRVQHCASRVVAEDNALFVFRQRTRPANTYQTLHQVKRTLRGMQWGACESVKKACATQSTFTI